MPSPRSISPKIPGIDQDTFHSIAAKAKTGCPVVQRLQKTLEDANIKLDSEISDIMGLSGRKMIEALIAGKSDPEQLAQLAHRRIKAPPEALREALRGRVTRHHRFLLRLHLQQIDAIDKVIADIDREVDALVEPFCTTVLLLTTIPGVDQLSACVILGEIGRDMRRFPTAGHLISWAGPRNAIATWVQVSAASHSDRERRHLAGRSAGARSDPGQLCAGSADSGDARAAAHPQAADTGAQPACRGGRNDRGRGRDRVHR